jgi:Spy/CpxP family protein refolding chaperone
MKQLLSQAVLCAAMTFCTYATAADPARPVRLEQVMLNPGIVMRYSQDLGLDETQLHAVREETQKSFERIKTLESALQQEVATLHEILQQSTVDEQKALAQLDKVLDAERLIKHAHLSLSLAIRAKLTAEQQAKVRDLQQKLVAMDQGHRGGQPTAPPGGPPEALKQKMQRISEFMGRARQDGRDMSAFQPLLQEIMPLMHQGKYNEAEPLMDKVLKMADEEGKKK